MSNFPEIKCKRNLRDILNEGIKYLTAWNKFKNGDPSEQMLYHFLKIDNVLKVFKEKKSSIKFTLGKEEKKGIAGEIYNSIFPICQMAVKISLLEKEFKKKDKKKYVAMEILNLTTPFKIFGLSNKALCELYHKNKLEQDLSRKMDECFANFFDLGLSLSKQLNTGNMPDFCNSISNVMTGAQTTKQSSSSHSASSAKHTSKKQHSKTPKKSITPKSTKNMKKKIKTIERKIKIGKSANSLRKTKKKIKSVIKNTVNKPKRNVTSGSSTLKNKNYKVTLDILKRTKSNLKKQKVEFKKEK